MKRYHFGCGPFKIDGWENYNREIDLRKPLPFPDAEAEFVFTEHVIEHLTPQEGWRFFEQCHRILAINGVVRTVFPDITKVWNLATPNYIDTLKRRGWGDGSPASSIHHLVFRHGHKSLWTPPLMITVLEAIGFEARQVPLNWSRHKGLIGLERHGEAIGKEANDLESVAVEGLKRT